MISPISPKGAQGRSLFASEPKRKSTSFASVRITGSVLNHNQRRSKNHLCIRNNVRLILVFLDVLNRGQEGGRGYFTALMNSLASARESYEVDCGGFCFK